MFKDNILILKTYDRQGRLAEHPVRFRQDGNRYVVAACSEQDAAKPDWYINLKSEPIVEIKVEGVDHFASADTPVGQDRLHIWPLVEELATGIEKRMPRNVTGVILTPMD